MFKGITVPYSLKHSPEGEKELSLKIERASLSLLHYFRLDLKFKKITERFIFYVIFIFILIFLFEHLAYSQRISNLSLDFTRLIYKDKRNEKISGKIFYSDSATLVKITLPINQWLLYQKNGITIYYPDEKSAMKISSSSPPFLPFFHSILGLVDENVNLDILHYTIIKRLKSGDTLKIFWKPPKELKGNIGEYHVSLLNDLIASVENFDSKNKLITVTHFENYKIFDHKNFPTKTITLTYIDKTVNKEEVYFSNISIINKIAPEIKNFKIPLDIKIKNIEW